MSSRKKYTVLLALVLAGEIIFFLPFVMARVFRPTILAAFEISNLELGSYFSIYGIVAMGSYFFGGPLADRFPARNLIAVALWLTALGGIALSTIPSRLGVSMIYGYWGFTTVFLFWSALIRATREWGGSGFQGRAFGLLEGGRGITAALIATLTLLIFSYLMPHAVGDVSDQQRVESFRWVILATSGITISTGIFVWFAIPPTMTNLEKREEVTSVYNVLRIAKIPEVWLQAIIIVSAYVGYKTTDDISLYAENVLSFNEVDAAAMGAGAIWLRPVFAIMAGFIADRYGGTRTIVLCFILILIGGLLVATGVVGTSWVHFVLLLPIMVAGVFGLRGIYFAVMQSASVPVVATGIAVGIMSVIGYTPDVFMSPLMGYLLDKSPGITGHQTVFWVSVVFALTGLVSSFTLHFRSIKNS